MLIKLSQYLGFLTIGLVSSIIGPMIGAIKIDIPMDYSGVGYILSGQFTGMLLTVVIGGYLSDKYGKKPVLIAGGMLLSLGLIGSMLSKNYASLMIWTLISGVGFGAYEVGINSLCADSSDSNKGGAMNYLHFFFGIGAIIGPLLATLCLKVFNSWQMVYGIVALFPVVVSLMLRNIKIVNSSEQHEGKNYHILKNNVMWLSGLFAFIYVGIEVSTYGWIPAFWSNIAPKSIIPSSLIAAVFWAALTFGRLITGMIVDKIGFSKYITIACLLTAILALIWVIVPREQGTFIAILFIGFFLAGLFPTLMISSTSYYKVFTGSVSAFISIFSSLGGSLIPSAVGKYADFAGITKLPLIILALSVLLLILAAVRSKLMSKVPEKYSIKHY